MHESEPYEYTPVVQDIRSLPATKGDIEDALAPIQILLARIYDLLVVIADKANPDTTQVFVGMHRKGGFYGPPPGFDPEYQRTLDESENRN